MSDPQQLADELRLSVRLILRRLNSEKSMPLGQVDTLALLARSGPLTGAEIARSERVSPPAVTSLLRPLIQAGYALMSPSETDKRVREVSITPLGREALEKEQRSAHAWLEKAIAEGLSDEERDRLAAALPVLARLHAQ